MAFRPTTAPRQILRNAAQESTSITTLRPQVEESQEWVLFSPSQVGSSTGKSSQTVGLSRTSGVESLQTAGRSQLDSDALEDNLSDGELDTLDDGLHAFQEPIYPIPSRESNGLGLPQHDGLGGFSASSPPVLEQLWQHEHFNPKRKHDGQHRRPSSVQRTLDTIEEREAQANEEKRVRIEKWRLEQSQAMLEEVERETRRQLRKQAIRQRRSSASQDLFGSTPKQSDFLRTGEEPEEENEPFWRRLTRRFIRDIIGIDDPLLSVILGESLPQEVQDPEPKDLSVQPTSQSSHLQLAITDDSWRDRLLQRIARELGVCVHAIAPHPGAFTTYTPSSSSQTHDYAGMRVTAPRTLPASHSTASQSGPVEPQPVFSSSLTPNFPPTIHNPHHAATWGFDDEVPGASLSTNSSNIAEALNLQREREYWERELDVRMVFRFLKERIVGSSPAAAQQAHTAVGVRTSAGAGYGSSPEDIGKRTAIIRQHHPLVARAHNRPSAAAVRVRRDSQTSLARVSRDVTRRPGSSCASESLKSKSSRGTGRRSSGSRNYWDLGGSVGSGSVLASGGLWGEV